MVKCWNRTGAIMQSLAVPSPIKHDLRYVIEKRETFFWELFLRRRHLLLVQ